MRLLPAVVLALAPAVGLAAGTDDTTPPTPTETTGTCTDGKIWDAETKTCVDATDARLDDDTRFRAARELAYDGQLDAALRVLAAMAEGDSDRVLTYKGFANRKAGRIDLGHEYYRQALQKNPDNILARSYMAQGFVEAGDEPAALDQLAEIRARGGAGTWAETALIEALKTGRGFSY